MPCLHGNKINLKEKSLKPLKAQQIGEATVAFWKLYACSNYVLLSKTCCQLLRTNKYWLANEALAEVPALAEAEAAGALLG